MVRVTVHTIIPVPVSKKNYAFPYNSITDNVKYHTLHFFHSVLKLYIFFMNNRAVSYVWLFSFPFQLIPKLTTNISTEIEKVLDNKPTRHPLQRWLEESRGPSQDLGSPLDKESSIDANADQPPPSLMDTIRSTCSLQWLFLCVTDKKDFLLYFLLDYEKSICKILCADTSCFFK